MYRNAYYFPGDGRVVLLLDGSEKGVHADADDYPRHA
jgi:hypothetical protein